MVGRLAARFSRFSVSRSVLIGKIIEGFLTPRTRIAGCSLMGTQVVDEYVRCVTTVADLNGAAETVTVVLDAVCTSI